MKVRQTLGNFVMVKLDPENNVVRTPSGFTLFIDTTFEPEKHTVVTGTVEALPLKLNDSKLPWRTENELQIGDKVVMYYMAVMNALAPQYRRFVKEGRTTWVFIAYSNIYTAIREGVIIPINGYLLAEPIPDPYFEKLKKRYEEKGIELVDPETKSNKNVVFARIVYAGRPNRGYNEIYNSDENVDVKPGDEVILKKIRDIPIEYEYHSTVDGGRKLYRIQRHDILSVL